MTACILLSGVERFTVSKVLLMAGRDRHCSVAWLVLYCVTVCILVFFGDFVTVSNIVFME